MATNTSNNKPISLKTNLEYTIIASEGSLFYRTSSIPLQCLMEELEDALKKKSATEIENILRAL